MCHHRILMNRLVHFCEIVVSDTKLVLCFVVVF